MRQTVQGWLEALDRQAARAYVVGPSLADAVRACRSLDAQDMLGTICYWSAGSDGPQAIAAECLRAVDAIHDARLKNSQLSVKAPPLHFSRKLLAQIVERAAERDVGLQFDSLSAEDADPTFELILDMLAFRCDVGCTLPGRWARSVADADRAAELGLRVRIVKGQWADPDARAPEADPRAGFLRVVDRVAGRVRHVSVATHDAVLAREALGRLLGAGTSCELELWFGLPIRPALRAGREAGVPVRLYVPYGHGSLPYAMWHVKTTPRVAWWACRDLYAATKFRVSPSAGIRARYGFLRGAEP